MIVELWEQGNAAALVTLVRVEGSSYRRPGARLLVTNDGGTVGAISGGCLEAEVARKARWAARSGAIVERLSTVFDDTTEIPYGLGCGGTVIVLLERGDWVHSRPKRRPHRSESASAHGSIGHATDSTTQSNCCA